MKSLGSDLRQTKYSWPYYLLHMLSTFHPEKAIKGTQSHAGLKILNDRWGEELIEILQLWDTIFEDPTITWNRYDGLIHLNRIKIIRL